MAEFLFTEYCKKTKTRTDPKEKVDVKYFSKKYYQFPLISWIQAFDSKLCKCKWRVRGIINMCTVRFLYSLSINKLLYGIGENILDCIDFWS